jgi:ATP-dependent Lhr-like helicase
MSANDELDQALEVHRAIRQRLANTWNAFFARFGTLRPVQQASILPILDRKNLLITAPTAGGKTEAVAAPVCEQIVAGRWTGLGCILITPTRALVNDLYHRLCVPFQEMGLRLGRKTSDHGISDRISEQFLITTPESAESLLTFRREALSSLRVVIMDEIHLLDGTPRGDQLRLLLARLQAYLEHVNASNPRSLQRIALSATVADPRRVAEVYLGPNSEVISIGGQRSIEARIVLADGDDEARAQAALEAAAEFDDVRKILVFVNSRKQVDAGAQFFRHAGFANVPAYGHHGSLSRSERENAEERFKSDARAICVATMTLEIGIDIGDVDLVICIDPPYSLSSFLQRIGRGCRRLQGKTRVVCVARDRAGELLFEGLIHQAARGIPPAPLLPFRRSVLIQQVLAYLRQVEKHRRAEGQFRNVFGSHAKPEVKEATIDEVLNDMLTTNLVTSRNGIYSPASDGQAFIESNRIFSNISTSPPEIALVDADTGKTVAFVKELDSEASGVRVAGRSFSVLGGPQRYQQLVRAGGVHHGSPKYFSRLLPYSFDLGAAVAARLGVSAKQLLVFRDGTSTVALTWLGRLLNLTVAESAKGLGQAVRASAFALHFTDLAPENVLSALKDAIGQLSVQNPLATAAIERVIDLGPHYRQLSESGRRRAREDWLDVSYLNSWVSNLSDARVVERSSELGSDVAELAST